MSKFQVKGTIDHVQRRQLGKVIQLEVIVETVKFRKGED